MYSGCYHTEWKCHPEHDDESSEDVILNGNVILNGKCHSERSEESDSYHKIR